MRATSICRPSHLPACGQDVSNNWISDLSLKTHLLSSHPSSLPRCAVYSLGGSYGLLYTGAIVAPASASCCPPSCSTVLFATPHPACTVSPSSRRWSTMTETTRTTRGSSSLHAVRSLPSSCSVSGPSYIPSGFTWLPTASTQPPPLMPFGTSSDFAAARQEFTSIFAGRSPYATSFIRFNPFSSFAFLSCSAPFFLWIQIIVPVRVSLPQSNKWPNTLSPTVSPGVSSKIVLF